MIFQAMAGGHFSSSLLIFSSSRLIERHWSFAASRRAFHAHCARLTEASIARDARSDTCLPYADKRLADGAAAGSSPNWRDAGLGGATVVAPGGHRARASAETVLVRARAAREERAWSGMGRLALLKGC